MHKLKVVLLLSSLTGISWANEVVTPESAGLVPDNQAFQKFDDQYYLGYGLNYGNSKNGFGQNTNYTANTIGFGVERLFDMGLWLRFDGSMMSGYSNMNSSNPNAVTTPVGQDPSFANLDFKLGYAFQPLQDRLLVTPYVLLGRNTNLSSNSLNNNLSPDGGTSTPTINTTQDYFFAGGFGGRIEYRIDNYIELYFDQNIIYNADMSQPNANYASASNFSFTSLLGAKFNVWDELQLGLNGYYSYFSMVNGPTSNQMYQLYPQNEIGGMVTIGLTY